MKPRPSGTGHYRTIGGAEGWIWRPWSQIVYSALHMVKELPYHKEERPYCEHVRRPPMNVEVYDLNGTPVAEMRSQGIVIRTARDAADVARQLLELGITRLILSEKNVCPEMWQISNGLAGAIAQEFDDKAIDVALVGGFSMDKNKRIQDFITGRKGNRFAFVASSEAGKTQLSL